jgi:hypothetical protein
MDKRRWWMAVVVLGAVSLLGCSKKTDTSTPDAGKISGTGGSTSTAGKSGGGGAAGTTTGTAGMGAIAKNVDCGDNKCAGSVPGTMMMLPGFSLADPCCFDAAQGTCGSVQTDMSCAVSPPKAPKCPTLFMGALAGCCATGNQCGIDATLMGRGCVDLKTVTAMIPMNFRTMLGLPSVLTDCDGVPLPVPDAGTAGTGEDAGL